jgi:hypothetical protein
MEATLPALCPLEVLDGVCQIDALGLDSGFPKGCAKERAGRPHTRAAFAILDVPGLLADQHESDGRRALANNGLRRPPPEVTVLTAGGSPPDRLQPR